jgi:hypothetical protein
MDGDVMDNQRLKELIGKAIESLPAANVRIVRLLQVHDIERDANRVRVEITFDLR